MVQTKPRFRSLDEAFEKVNDRSNGIPVNIAFALIKIPHCEMAGCDEIKLVFDHPETPYHIYVEDGYPVFLEDEDEDEEDRPKYLSFNFCSCDWEDQILTSSFEGEYFFATEEGTRNSEAEMAFLLQFLNKVRRTLGFTPILEMKERSR
ncbi:MAG: hypothetical protein DCF22_21730 [Leptolyngbya sp.]|nr:MAG: hypothetical protein DCF22_21730 [Leptolyngbya sp.]